MNKLRAFRSPGHGRMDAAAILTDPEGARIAADVLADYDVALIVTQDPRAALAFASALWFGAQPETMVAVTGTNGKTSVASFTRQIWQEAGSCEIGKRLPAPLASST